jgi:hypothetical protein
MPDYPTKPVEGESYTREDVETAYRRGFYQGATAAVEGVEAHKTLRDLNNWLIRL